MIVVMRTEAAASEREDVIARLHEMGYETDVIIGEERSIIGVIGKIGQLYPGVRETLAALDARGIPMAVVSNKEGEFARKLLEVHGIKYAFSEVVFGDSLAEKKPSPLPIRHCMNKFLSIPPRTLLIGDSEIDVQTARNADVAVWAVSYGYRKKPHARELGADRVIDSVVDVLPALRSRTPIWADRAHAGAE